MQRCWKNMLPAAELAIALHLPGKWMSMLWLDANDLDVIIRLYSHRGPVQIELTGLPFDLVLMRRTNGRVLAAKCSKLKEDLSDLP